VTAKSHSLEHLSPAAVPRQLSSFGPATRDWLSPRDDLQEVKRSRASGAGVDVTDFMWKVMDFAPRVAPHRSRAEVGQSGGFEMKEFFREYLGFRAAALLALLTGDKNS
jgi:hypothetical protein